MLRVWLCCEYYVFTLPYFLKRGFSFPLVIVLFLPLTNVNRYCRKEKFRPFEFELSFSLARLNLLCKCASFL